MQERLGRRILLENPSSYLVLDGDMPEHEFLAELAGRADCGILLDVNNVFVSAHNHGWDPRAYLAAMPAERVGQVHLAGHTDDGALLIDTHDGYVVRRRLAALCRGGGAVRGALDDDRMGRGRAAVRGAGSGARPGGPLGEERWGGGAMRPERAPRLPLASIQAALLSRITGRELGGPAFDVASSIRGDTRGSAEERLAVYSFMYRSRFVEALASQFPRLARLVGADAFADLTAAYVADWPSRHPSLRELGRALPGWLAAQRPDEPDLAGLAALEWARADVYDLADEPTMTLDAPRAFPPERFGELPLRLIGAHRFIEVDGGTEALWDGLAPERSGCRPSPRAAPGRTGRHVARLAPRDRGLSPRGGSGRTRGARTGVGRQQVRRHLRPALRGAPRGSGRRAGFRLALDLDLRRLLTDV